MRVSISKAADMVGVTRATLYRHIDKKGITVLKDEDGNPKIDVSELIRVYGDKVQVQSSETGEAVVDAVVAQVSAPVDHAVYTAGSPQMEAGIEVLRERLRSSEAALNQTEVERERERQQLLDHIERLQDGLHQSQEQQKRLTLLLTDQRQKAPVRAPQEHVVSDSYVDQQGVRDEVQGEQMHIMEKTIQKLQNQNKRIYYELQKQKEQGLFEKLFGSKVA